MGGEIEVMPKSEVGSQIRNGKRRAGTDCSPASVIHRHCVLRLGARWCLWLRLQLVVKNLLINRLITLQSPNALLSVLFQPPEKSLVILICSEESHPWNKDPQVTSVFASWTIYMR